MPHMQRREFDIVLFGATGFTGELVARYLATRGPEDLRFAIAGRSREKLREVRERLAALRPELASLEMITASVERPESLRAMAERARVIITTVGPYVRYGEPVVRAALEAGADYVDITGEPEFVDRVIRTYDARAREAKIRIVNCCGFDSIPHDLGAYFTVKQLPSDRPITVEAFVRFQGQISGGTWHSAIGAFSELRRTREASKPPAPTTGRKVSLVERPLRRGPYGTEWALLMPTIDPQVVLRSAAALEDYGPDFRYGHYLHVRTTTKLLAVTAGVGAAVALAQFGPTRRAILKWKVPGEGPSEEERAKGAFEVTFVGEAEGGPKVETRFAGGDPGYTETAKMLAESALCLARDAEKLPPRYGVLTPAAAMGDALLERLTAAGLVIERVS
ncbi:MAG: saccharopine dehydrogenase [Myxococcales bacterium]|nr:saccharopine dehydrogenase [Myxococcales bacterium]